MIKTLFLDEKFKLYIRRILELNGIDNYNSFLVSVARINGRPSFEICLDGTYSELWDHLESIICFCYTNSKTICFIKDIINHNIRTANPPDKMHDYNWNQKSENDMCFQYKHFIFNQNIFDNFGKYEVENSSEDFLILESTREVVFVNYKTKLNEYAGYFDRIKIS